MRYPVRLLSILSLFIIFLLFSSFPVPVRAQSALLIKASADKSKKTELAEPEAAASLDEVIDARVKAVLAEQQQTDAPQVKKKIHEGRFLRRLLFKAEGAGAALSERAVFLLEGFRSLPSEYIKSLRYFADEKNGGAPVFLMIIGVFAMIGAGASVEWLIRQRMADLRQKLAFSPPSGSINRFMRIGMNLTIELFLVIIFGLFTFLLFTSLLPKMTAIYYFFAAGLLIAFYIRMTLFLLNIFFSPDHPLLRIIPMGNNEARFLRKWITGMVFVGVFIGLNAILFNKVAKMPEANFLAVYNIAGGCVFFLIILMIWKAQDTIARKLRNQFTKTSGSLSPLQEKFLQTSHIIAILYVICIAVFWEIGILIEADRLVDRMVVSLLCFPVFIAIDQWGQYLLRITFEMKTPPAETEAETPDDASADETDAAAEEGDDELNGDDDWDEPEKLPKSKGFIEEIPAYMAVERYIPLIRRVFRGLLILVMFFFILDLWGFDWPFGQAVTEAALSIVITLVLAYLFWEFAKGVIDRKLKETMPDEDEEMEEGGAGGSRSGTLLLLLRKTLLGTLVIMVGMIVLSAVGVDIGPLIAGAGIVGLAIGFGAQTLVKDIISGIFFLIDDAFRIGDYVDTGSLKGTVEQISIRSLRLRHHRGMVHTIPFGGLKSVTNFSRDYIIEKLTFRVRYDTNVDQVRKIIKKIYKEISKDEDLGPNLLGKIKSQGVKGLDDSAMVMRVKFKSVPGEQFMIRRVIYQKMQEKFRKAGIQFAHRNVTVYLPQQEEQENNTKNDKADEEKTIAEAGAGAAVALIQEEEAKQKAASEKKK